MKKATDDEYQVYVNKRKIFVYTCNKTYFILFIDRLVIKRGDKVVIIFICYDNNILYVYFNVNSDDKIFFIGDEVFDKCFGDVKYDDSKKITEELLINAVESTQNKPLPFISNDSKKIEVATCSKHKEIKDYLKKMIRTKKVMYL